MSTLPQPEIAPVRDADVFFGLWPWSKGPQWEVDTAWPFVAAGRKFVIPAGYLFDKASIPSFLWGFPMNYTPDGLCTVAALEHDFLCDLLRGGSDWLREQCDPAMLIPLPAESVHRHFYDRLLEYGVRPSKARTMYAAVRNFGPGGRALPSSWFK